MNPDEVSAPKQTRCDNCSQLTPSYDLVNCCSLDRKSRNLCSACFNSEMAGLSGLTNFAHNEFQPVSLADSTGTLHEFHFRNYLFGPGVSIEAFELRNGCPAGYQFRINGDPNDDLLRLLARLIEKIRRGLSSQYLTMDRGQRQIADKVAQGWIEWDDNHDGRLPLLVIDGRQITWDEFGRMLMTFEGWQFKLSIADPSDEF